MEDDVEKEVSEGDDVREGERERGRGRGRERERERERESSMHISL